MKRLVALFFLAALALTAAEEKPAPPPPITVADIPSPAGPRAVGATLTTGPDGTQWLTWVEAAASNAAAASAKTPAEHHHATEPAAKSPTASAPNTLRFSTFDAAAKKWSPARTIASRADVPISSADFPQLVLDGRGTATAVWTDGHGGALVSSSSDRGATWSTPTAWTTESQGVEKFSFVRLADGRVLAAWLDNRAHKSGATVQQLFARILGNPAPDVLVDPSVCDCCQTTLTAFPDGGALLAYRGRTTDEVRDIRTARFLGREWNDPRPLNNDDWRIAACPINGPRLASDGGRVAVAWYTGADNDPRVLASYSPDAGTRFLLPLRLDRGKPVGHVDTMILHDGAMLATWLETDGSLWLRRINPDFAADEPFALAPAGTLSPKTNPRVSLLRDYAGGTSPVEFLLTYATDSALRTLVVTVPEGALLTAKGNCDCAPTPEQLVGYSIRGAVAAVSTERGTVHLVHEELPGLFFSGTHEFHADPSVLTAVQLGRRLFGRIEQRNGQWWLFDVRLTATR